MRVPLSLILLVTSLSGCVSDDYGYHGDPEGCWYEHVVYEESYCPPADDEYWLAEECLYP